jgi:hypothetical protein
LAPISNARFEGKRRVAASVARVTDSVRLAFRP